MQFELDGQLKVVYDVQTFASGFQKREFVVTTSEMYPQEIKFELVKDKSVPTPPTPREPHHP